MGKVQDRSASSVSESRKIPKNCNGHTKGEHLFTAENAESAEFQRVFSAFLAYSAVKFLFALSVTNTKIPKNPKILLLCRKKYAIMGPLYSHELEVFDGWC